ncbi:unnamed protein product, partial [Owenia fusiformis]
TTSSSVATTTPTTTTVTTPTTPVTISPTPVTTRSTPVTSTTTPVTTTTTPIPTTSTEIIDGREAKIVVYGLWSSWFSWVQCSATCGEGVQKRSRVCQKSSPTDVDCDGSEEVTRACNNGR